MAALASSARNVPSLSSASTTKCSPSSQAAPVPISLRSPPIRNDGRRPASTRINASMEEVVVLPCVPATATVARRRHRAASMSARRSTGRPDSWARTTSGLRPVWRWRSARTRARRPGCRAVTDGDIDTHGPQPGQPGRLLHVAARDAMAHTGSRGDGTHAGADHMDRRGDAQVDRARSATACSSMRSATAPPRRDASARRPPCSSWPDARDRRAAVRARRTTRAPSSSPSASRRTDPDQGTGVGGLVIAGRYGQGDEQGR